VETIAPSPNLPPIAPYIQSCIPYPPGKPIEELERELNLTNVIKLASNENPVGTSPKALEAIQKNISNLRLYPDASHFYLREKLAAYNGVSFDEILVGNGSNEIIDFLIRAFCKMGENVISCGAAFVAYRVCAQVHGVEYREPALQKDLVAELDQMLTLVDQNTRIIFLPNPNNPTGTYVRRDVLEQFLSRLRGRPIIVVLDYAYWEYVTADDLPDPIEMYRKYPNIVVTRTFSKIYGLAGLRIGYGIGHPEILSPMRKVKMPFNVSNLGLVAAAAALEDIAHVKRSFEVNCDGMDYLEKEIKRLGLDYWQSQGNFLLVRFADREAKDIYEAMLKEGVIVRPVAGYGLRDHLRISIGTKEENTRLIKTLELVLQSS
jgi:histidinol-phosphate aminotransferase